MKSESNAAVPRCININYPTGEEEKLVLVVLDGDDNQVIFPEGDWVSVLSFESVTNLTSGKTMKN